VRGLAFLAARHDTEAATEFQKTLDQSGSKTLQEGQSCGAFVIATVSATY
jgi:hypothetical protein